MAAVLDEDPFAVGREHGSGAFDNAPGGFAAGGVGGPDGAVGAVGETGGIGDPSVAVGGVAADENDDGAVVGNTQARHVGAVVVVPKGQALGLKVRGDRGENIALAVNEFHPGDAVHILSGDQFGDKRGA